MKLNKKGFTLIELLAVIVVLALILVIAVPRIMDVISKAAQGSLDQSAKMVAKYMQKDYALKMLDGSTPTPTAGTDVACPTEAGFDATQMECKYTLVITDNQPTYTVTMTGTSGRLDGKTATATE